MIFFNIFNNLCVSDHSTFFLSHFEIKILGVKSKSYWVLISTEPLPMLVSVLRNGGFNLIFVLCILIIIVLKCCQQTLWLNKNWKAFIGLLFWWSIGLVVQHHLNSSFNFFNSPIIISNSSLFNSKLSSNLGIGTMKS